jgi:hypothetical protein
MLHQGPRAHAERLCLLVSSMVETPMPRASLAVTRAARRGGDQPPRTGPRSGVPILFGHRFSEAETYQREPPEHRDHHTLGVLDTLMSWRRYWLDGITHYLVARGSGRWCCWACRRR